MDTTASNPTRQTAAGFPAAPVDDALRERLRKQPVVARTAATEGRPPMTGAAATSRTGEEGYDKALPVPGEIFAVKGASIANYDGEALKGGAPKPAAPIRLADKPDYAEPPAPAVQALPPAPAPIPLPPAPASPPPEPPPPAPEPKQRLSPPPPPEPVVPKPEPPSPPPEPPLTRMYQGGAPSGGQPSSKNALAVFAVLLFLVGGGLLLYVNHQAHQQAAALAKAEQQWQARQKDGQPNLDELTVGNLKATTVTIKRTLDAGGDINTDGTYKIKGVPIASGDLADSGNFAYLNAPQIFTGANTFSNSGNTFVGNGAGLTGITATTLDGHSGAFYQNISNINIGTLSVARLPDNVTLQGNSFNGASQLVKLDGVGRLPALDGSLLTGVTTTTLNGQPGSFYQDASNLNAGILPDARLSSNVTLQGNSFNGASQLVQLTAGGILPVLDGSNLTNIDAITLQGNDSSYFTDASNIGSGTLGDARLSSNVALLDRNSQTFTGNNEIFKNGADSTTAFQIQNSTSSPLLIADTTNMTLSVRASSSQSADIFRVEDSTGTAYLSVGASGGVLSRRTGAGPTTSAYAARGLSDSANRINIQAGGTIQWGDGTSALDTDLYRNGVGTLATDGWLEALGGSFLTDTGYLQQTSASATTDIFLDSKLSGDTTSRFRITADGTLNWGPGNAARDTSLSRSAAGQLTTNGDLVLQGGDLLTNQTTATLFNTTATTLNIGGAATAASGGINLAGGSGSTGCSIDGTTGNLACSGTISTTNTSGTVGFWTRNNGTTTLSPATSGDSITTTGAIQGGTLSSVGALGTINTDANGVSLQFSRASANYIKATTAGGYLNFVVNGNSSSDATSALHLASNGSATFRNGTDNSTAFQIQNTSGTAVVTADTTNTRVNVVGDLNVGSRFGSRLFSDNFESGGFALWPLTPIGSLSMTTSTVHDGKYSAQVNPASTQAYTEASVAPENTAYARAWVYVSSQTSSNADLLTLSSSSGGYWTLYRNGGSLHLYNGVTNSDAGSGGSFTTGAWHLLELRVTIGSPTGTTQAWLDGTQVVNNTSQLDGTNQIDTVEIGDDAGSRTFTAYIDDVVADTVPTGTASSLNVDDSLHVGGSATFGNDLLVNVNDNETAAIRLTETNDRGFNLLYDGGPNQFVLQANDTGTLSNVMTVQRTSGATLFQNSSDSTSAFQVQGTGDQALLTVDTQNGQTIIRPPSGTGAGVGKLVIQSNWTDSSGDEAQLLFGEGADSGVSAGKLYYTGVNNTIHLGGLDGSGTTTDVLTYDRSGAGVVLQSTNTLNINSTGANNITLAPAGTTNTGVLIKPSANDSTAAFSVQNKAGTSHILDVNTTNGTVSIDSTAPTSQSLYVWAGTSREGLLIDQDVSSTSSLLKLQHNGSNVVQVTSSGNVLAGGAATATTATTSGTGTNTTTVALTAANSLANGDVIFIDNAGQDYFTRITAGGGTTSLTVSPAVTYENARTVTKYNVQYLGSDGTNFTGATRNQNSFFQGYFTGGVVTGAGSTIYSDGNINSVNTLQITAPTIQLNNTSNSTDAFQIQNAASDSFLQVDTLDSTISIGGSVALPPSGGGTVGTWTATTSLSTALFGASSVAYNGYIYEMGGTTNGTSGQTAVYYAPLNGDGTVGTWNTTTALPNARFNATSVVYNGYVYVIGGNNGTSDQATVYYAPLNGDGTVGTWNTTTSLSGGLQLATSAVNNGYVYVLGGASSGTNQTAVYYAPLNGDGTVGTWNTTTALSTALAGATTAVSNGYIYEMGGGLTSTCSGSNTSATAYAQLNGDGTVGTWNTAPSMSNGRFGSAAVTWGGYLYNLSGTFTGGGCGVAGVTNMDAQTNSDGSITSWSSTSGPYGAWQTTAAVYNGYAYELGGTTDGSTALTTVQYATVSGNDGIPATGGGHAVDLNVHGSALFRPNTDSSTAFQIQNASASPVFTVDTTDSSTILQAGMDAATFGSNLITTTDFTNAAWTSTNWTTTTSTAAHNTGNTSPLYSNQFTATANATYQISYTISGTPASSSTLSVRFGSTSGSGGCVVKSYTFDGTSLSNFSDTQLTTCNSTSGEISFNPGSTFNGTISNVSIKLVSLNSKPALVIDNAAGAANVELRASSGATSLFLGLKSGQSDSGSGSYNTGLGSYALQNNTTGGYNTAVGALALQDSTTGWYNTAVGRSALGSNTIGYYNTAVGYNSLGSNVAGYYNAALGYNALANNTLGRQNTAVGYSALSSNTVGTQNTALGYNANVSSNNLTNATAIGYNASVSASNTVVLGSAACVAINLTACNTAGHASEKLGVSGDIIASGAITGSSTPDISETIPAAADVQAYDVVSAGPDGRVDAVRSTAAYDPSAIGVISDGTSTFRINSNAGSEAAADTGKYLVLAGRVPVHVTDEGGPIEPGDYLTTSSTPGYAMKATHAGPTIGKALASFDGTSGTVMTQTSLSYWSGPTIAGYIQDGGSATLTTLAVTGTGDFSDINVSGAASVHDLSVSGTATIAVLHVTGDARFDGPTVSFSSNVRGINQPVTDGATSVMIRFITPHPDADYAVQCTPSYDTNCYVTGKTAGGFTIDFGAPPPDGKQTVDWFVVR